MARSLALLVAVGLMASCRAGAGPPELTPAALSRSDGGRQPYTRADVSFMSGMIGHHAQAVLMAGWAGSHGANPSLAVLCERIVVAQRDEIALMQRWLRERGESVPAGDAAHDMMPGMGHSSQMPGILTADELRRLDQARGVDWERLFLTYMIRHHEGALTMVQQLFSSNGGGQEETIFKLASDIHVDQITEIDRMTLMLSAYPPGPKHP